MNPNRQQWNEQQKILQAALPGRDDFPRALELFLAQHASVHAAEVSGTKAWSFADEVLGAGSSSAWRRIPENGEHSIAWVIWHLARVEDITMNLLVAGTPQILAQGGWLARMKTSLQHSGNAMDIRAVEQFSQTVDLEALQEYRAAVGRRTREIALQLDARELHQKTDPARLDRIRAEGAVLDSASEIIAYWGGRTIAGLLLMPATRHNFLHLNEALRIRQKCR